MASVKLGEVIEKEKLRNLTPEIDISGIKIKQPDVNRPAVQLAGYFEHFDAIRIQIIGFVEHSYMQNMPLEKKERIYSKMLSMGEPCVIFCRELTPDEIFIKYARLNNVPSSRLPFSWRN